MWNKPQSKTLFPSEGVGGEAAAGGLVILCGPSGVGKSSLISHLLTTYGRGQIRPTVSYTTRPPRPGEEDGKDYHFVSLKRFEELKTQNFFVEWANVYHHCYGTSRQQIQDLWKRGLVVIKDLDLQGACRMKEVFPECVRVFILPPSVEDLKERVRGGGRPFNQEVQDRIRQAGEEMARAQELDHQLMNRDFAQTLQELKKIIESRFPSVIQKKVEAPAG